MGRIIVIHESAERDIVSSFLQEAFHPSAEKVLLVKDYLDQTFTRSDMDDIDETGYPTKVKTVLMLSSNGQPLRQMDMRELLMVLDDKFNGMISDEVDRKKFLKQVIMDWYRDKIGRNGLLSVNSL